MNKEAPRRRPVHPQMPGNAISAANPPAGVKNSALFHPPQIRFPLPVTNGPPPCRSDDSEDDADDLWRDGYDVVVPPRTKPLPANTRLSDVLRRDIFYLVTKNPQGLSIKDMTEFYAKEFKSSLDAWRNCGCSLNKLLEALDGDILVRDPAVKTANRPSIYPIGHIFERTIEDLPVPTVPPSSDSGDRRTIADLPVPIVSSRIVGPIISPRPPVDCVPPIRQTSVAVDIRSSPPQLPRLPRRRPNFERVVGPSSHVDGHAQSVSHAAGTGRGSTVVGAQSTPDVPPPTLDPPGIRQLPPPPGMDLRKVLRNCILITRDLVCSIGGISYEGFQRKYLVRFRHQLPLYRVKDFESFVNSWDGVAFRSRVTHNGERVLDAFSYGQRSSQPVELLQLFEVLEGQLKVKEGEHYYPPEEMIGTDGSVNMPGSARQPLEMYLGYFSF